MYIHVKVIPGVRKEEWKVKSHDHFEAKVRENAQYNKANTRVLELVAKHFNTSINRVRIVNGHHSPSKLIGID